MEGETVNRLGLFLNPNVYSIHSLTQWNFDGVTAWGEDHDSWSAASIRRFLRDEPGQLMPSEPSQRSAGG